MLKKISILTTLFLGLGLLGSGWAQSQEEQLVAQLRAAPNNTARVALLHDSDFVFDFLHATSGVSTGDGGHTVQATSGNFPALIGNGVSMTIGFLDACGLNTPHTHPRATEINYVVNGSLRTGMLAENGARFVFNEVPAGSAAIFPHGAIHFEQNSGCEPVIFVAAFNDEDPGVDAISQRYFGLPVDIVGAALGGLTAQEVAEIESKIPNNIALGSDECLQRCGITRPALQLDTQRQPRNSANPLPSGFSGPTQPADLSPSATGAIPTPTSAGGNLADKLGVSSTGVSPTPTRGSFLADSGSQSSSQGSDTKPLIAALLAINGAFVIGTLVALAFYLRSRSHRAPSSNFGSYIRTASPTLNDEILHSRQKGSEDYYDPYSVKH